MTATHHDVDPAGMPADGTTPSPIPSDGLGRPAVAGLVAAAVALGTTELVAGLLPVSYTHLTLPTKRIV